MTLDTEASSQESPQVIQPSFSAASSPPPTSPETTAEPATSVRSMPSPKFVALVTRAIGLLNQAMDLDYEPFDHRYDPKEADRLGYSEYSRRERELDDVLGFEEYRVRERELDRARACMLRAMATPEQRADELARAHERIEEHHHPILDQLILELGFRDCDGVLLGAHFVPEGQYIQDIGTRKAAKRAKAAKVSRGRRAA